MNIHEYQAKKIFQKFGIPILKGHVAYTCREAEKAVHTIGGTRWAVKAQIHSDTRELGHFVEQEAGTKSGIRMVSSPAEAIQATGQMLGKTLITPSTGTKGREVKKVYIEEQVDIASAYALAIFIDFSTEKVVLSVQNLDEKKTNNVQYELDLNKRLLLRKAVLLMTAVKMPRPYRRKAGRVILKMFEIFKTYCAFRIDINPLAITADGRLVALDGKIAFDPDAISRFKEITVLRDVEEETPSQIKSRLNNFRYTEFDGNIGVIVNGSGLGIATLDLLHLLEAKPACILDLGGEPTKETVANAFKTVLSEPNVEGILLNIFGSNSRCDMIAQGLITAAREISIGMPLVVRMDGTNAQIGCRLLFESGLPFIVKKSMDGAVKRIIKSVQEIV